MNVTETEAGNLWCPFTRVVPLPMENGYVRVTPPVGNRVVIEGVERSSGFPQSARCIASQCMLWQWSEKPTGEYRGFPASIGKGFCGMGRTG